MSSSVSFAIGGIVISSLFIFTGVCYLKYYDKIKLIFGILTSWWMTIFNISENSIFIRPLKNPYLEEITVYFRIVFSTIIILFGTFFLIIAIASIFSPTI
jgi:hypothetical protein